MFPFGSELNPIDPLMLEALQCGLLPSKKVLFKNLITDGSLRSLLRYYRNLYQQRYSNPYENKASYSEVDYLYIKNFLNIPHPYGITLSVDIIGSDCQISQNATIGTNGKYQDYDQGTKGFKPRLGFCVKVNAGALISGAISIGSFSIIAGGAVVTKDVPPFSITYGTNCIKPISEIHHYKTLLHVLYHSLVVSRHPPGGLLWHEDGLCVSNKYKEIQEGFLDHHEHDLLRGNPTGFFAFARELMDYRRP